MPNFCTIRALNINEFTDGHVNNNYVDVVIRHDLHECISDQEKNNTCTQKSQFQWTIPMKNEKREYQQNSGAKMADLIK